MEFDGININFNSQNTGGGNPADNKPLPENQADINNKELKNTPSDPKFWQAQNNISFRGNKAQNLQQASEDKTSVENASKEAADKGLQDEINKFTGKEEKRQKRYEGYKPAKCDAILAVKSSINPETGKIDERVSKFLDRYYFQNSLADKIRYRTGSSKYYADYDYNMGRYVVDIIDLMKDKDGNFNDTNIDFLTKAMESKVLQGNFDRTFFDNMKDENGVIDKKLYNLGMDFSKTDEQMHDIAPIIKTCRERGFEQFNFIFESLKIMFEDDEEDMGYNIYGLIKSFPALSDFCFDKEGCAIQENCIFAAEALKKNKYLIFRDNLCRAAKNEESREIILEFSQNGNVGAIPFILSRWSDSSGNLDPFIKNKLHEFSRYNIGLNNFNDIIENCLKSKDGSVEENFDSELYYTALKLFGSTFNGVRAEYLFEILKDDFRNVQKLDFKTKVDIYNRLKVSLGKMNPEEKSYASIEKALVNLDKSLNEDSAYVEVDEVYKKEFISSVVKSNGEKGGLTNFEKVIKDSIPLLKSMDEGLNLTYSRKDFLSDLSRIITNQDDLEILADKTGIEPLYDKTKENIELKGYEGIITLDNLNLNDEFERQVYDICHKFMYENEVKTGNKELDTELNKIIKAAPEFINTIGKVQHGTQKYTLDIHELLVLANSINNPDYENLNGTDKAMLKTACIFHDTAKRENVVDKGHQGPSALWARGIIKKFYNNPEAIDRIYELIANHHWLEEYSNAGNKDLAAKEIAFKFRRPNDFDIAKIMARSDLMAVSDDFYNMLKGALDEDKIKPVENNLDYIYSTGNAIFSDYFIDKSVLDNFSQEYKGKKYNVINFHNIKGDESLKKYGFQDVKKNDAKLLVHMIPEQKRESYLETVKRLTSSINGGVLSESLITPQYQRTYQDRKYGVLLSQINPNIINTCESNQGSGQKKGMRNIMRLIYDTPNRRQTFKEDFLGYLSFNKSEISDTEFAEFYRNVLANKTSLSQFADSKEYKIGSKKVTGLEIKKAFEEYQDSLIDKKEEIHNEIVGYVPKIQAVIAKAKSLKEVPDELLKFADENKLPVVLI